MKIKRILCALLVVVALIGAFPMAAFAQSTSASVSAAAATAKLSKTSLKLVKGKTATLKVKGYKGKITWSSNNKSVATVTKGKVKAVKPGSALITAKLANGKKLKCKVTVSTSALTITRSNTTSESETYSGKKITYKLQWFAIKNNSSKDIKEIDIAVRHYDKNGKIIKYKDSNGKVKDYYVVPFNVPVSAGSTTRFGFDFNGSYENIRSKRVEITVTKIVYA